MTQVKIKLTVEEFLALPENDTTYEFVDGEAIPKYKNQQMSPKFFHGSTTGALFIILSTWAQAKGRVVVEWAIKLTKNQEIWIPVPDLTYSTSRCYEVQEPHPQPPPRKRGGGYDVFDIIRKRHVIHQLIISNLFSK
ncbi:Uma2 family endonuclease [Dolichospermum circinale CS-534/05]|nr:Uma2 family endonuclease [Dolichospermum circinale]MDB9454028.1 Uma2 family endonuclease [Dolichospermum circinale CS-541/06]MDB9463203.1 Uma2 family endonuclease [Dolichospermum circinale CS-541/04]MDB9473884.1 Uma2 family endonuclease [Dolichospermum circinale CS-537/11]MDB9479326.1 Uma2 family endonuclease [Dolichospermum circinale CS-537/03]MDB9491228.1 Uma2 family endonuclease [Dolichospermum circinale CS-534/05]